MTHVISLRWKKKGKDIVGERVKIDRSTRWGNPFVSRFHMRYAFGVIHVDDPVAAYKAWLNGTAFTKLEQKRRNEILEKVGELKGKVLMCWCKPRPCHGDVLAEMAEKHDVDTHTV